MENNHVHGVTPAEVFINKFTRELVSVRAKVGLRF